MAIVCGIQSQQKEMGGVGDGHSEKKQMCDFYHGYSCLFGSKRELAIHLPNNHNVWNKCS
jgi:hypothetical protein